MIDLHMHSTNSDGTDSVLDLLKKAESMKLDYISITDHDNCNGYEELKNIDISKYYSGKIIPGIEIKCSHGKHLIEVLGYNIDTDKMKKWSDEYYKDKSRDKLQMKYFDMLYDACIKMGLEMKNKEDIEWDPVKGWASGTIYHEIKAHPENESRVPADMWEEFDTFSKKYCADPNCPLYIDKSLDYPTTEYIVQVVKDCGGLAFLPHLFIYKWTDEKEKLIDEILGKYDVDGIECMHSTFTDEQIEYLTNLCKERGYLMSGGSDYHGKNKPNIEMAIGKGNLKIEKEMIKPWANKFIN